MPAEALVLFFQNSAILSPEMANEIAAAFTPRDLDKNDFLLKEGRISDDYYFLEKGFMRAFAFDTDGNDVTTNFYGAGQMVFEVSSFFTRTPSRENIQALENCTGWSITFAQLNHLFHTLQPFREFGRRILVNGFAALKSRMLSHITETAEQRYEALLKSNPEIFKHAQLKHIASYLGITDTSLSRIRKEFGKK